MNKDVEILLKEDKHDFSSLVRIMALLRSENGCPWDKEQTHESIRANMIEETYEVIEAIDNQDPVLMREELGDALLQIVFHARISEESNEFSINDVIHDICAKLIHRHPHIFANVQADTSDEVLSNWEAIKTEEKQRVGLTGTLDSIPPALPALMRAQKMVKKSVKAGVDPAINSVTDGLASSVSQLSAALVEENADSAAEHLGHALWQLATVAQKCGLDAEKLLSDRCVNYVNEVKNVENTCADQPSFSEKDKETLIDKNFY